MSPAAMARFFALLTLAADVFVVASVLVWILRRRVPSTADLYVRGRAFFAAHGLQLAAAVALTCTLGSLYLSEVANYLPCKLCWYQRIAMYPLVPILGVATWKRDTNVIRYAAPLALIGSSISIYHYLLERFPQMSTSASCDPTAPCTILWIWEFNFISIPFMALSGFAAIMALLLWARPVPQEERAHEFGIARGAAPQGSVQTSRT